MRGKKRDVLWVCEDDGDRWLMTALSVSGWCDTEHVAVMMIECLCRNLEKLSIFVTRACRYTTI